jgi:hypothetical protein
MPHSETKHAPFVARSRPPIIGLAGCLAVAALMLFLAYALYHTAGHLGGGGGAGVGGMRVPPGEHGPGGAVLGWLLGLLLVLLLSLLPWVVQIVLALLSGLFLVSVFIVGLWVRIKKPIQWEIDERGVASYGLFRDKRFEWGELCSVKKEMRFVKLEMVAHSQRKAKSIFVGNVDVSREEILAAIRQYRPDLVPASLLA